MAIKVGREGHHKCQRGTDATEEQSAPEIPQNSSRTRPKMSSGLITRAVPVCKAKAASTSWLGAGPEKTAEG